MQRPARRLIASPLFPGLPSAGAAQLYRDPADLTPYSTLNSSRPYSTSPAGDLPESSTATPPILPWPSRLSSRRLARLIRRQTNPSLAFLAFQHATRFVPGFRHNHLTYGALIELLARARAFGDLERVLDQLALSDPPVRCEEEPFVAVIRTYGLASRPAAAMQTFLTVRQRFGVDVTVRSFNELLNAMVRNRRADLVVRLFGDCLKRFGIKPNVCTCNIFVNSMCKMGDIGGAAKVLEEMPMWGVIPDVVTYTTVLAKFCSKGEMSAARELFSEMLDRGLHPDAATYTVIIDGYCRLGRLVDAARLMDEMEANEVAPNEITYSVMIEACCKAGRSGEAMNLLVDMLATEHIPSPAMCSRVIDALCEDEKAEVACLAWKKMLKRNCMNDNSVLSTLVHWLCREGKVHQAVELFREFEGVFMPSVLTYNTFIAAACGVGELHEASSLWEHMLEKRCSPNGFTFNVLVAGYCKARMMREAVLLFDEMVKKGFVPSKATYEALADGFQCSGAQNGLYHAVASLVAGGESLFVDGNCWEVLVRQAVILEEIRVPETISSLRL